MSMSKKELIEQIRILEHNYDVANEFLEQQARNFREYISRSRKQGQAAVEAPAWIYRDLPPGFDKELLHRVETALGYRLFIWQKTLIAMGQYRQTGRTTAEILRELLQTDKPPIDWRRPPKDGVERCYRQAMIEIKRKLNAAGIATREIITSSKERRG